MSKVWNCYIDGPQGYVFLCGGYRDLEEAEDAVIDWSKQHDVRGECVDYRIEPDGDPSAADNAMPEASIADEDGTFIHIRPQPEPNKGA